MKTRELVEALVSDIDSRGLAPARALAFALIPAIAIALSLHLAVLGLRPHLFSLLGDPRIAFKIGLTILLALLSFRLVLRLVTPGATLRIRRSSSWQATRRNI